MQMKQPKRVEPKRRVLQPVMISMVICSVCGCGGDVVSTVADAGNGGDTGSRDLAAGNDLTAVGDVAVTNHTLNMQGVFHQPGGTDPKKNCTSCHGVDFGGGTGPSCYDCHNADDHQTRYGGKQHRSGPWNSCTSCHGLNNSGGLGRACSDCHG
jgi:hypothetical protein